MKLAIVDGNRRDAEDLRDILTRTEESHALSF